MRAISQHTLGGPEVLTEVRLTRPTPGPGEVLIRVRAAGLNPTDWKHRAIAGLFLPAPPFVLGWDVSGEVAETGIGVTLWQPGDELFGMLPYPNGHGALAEYVVGPARAFARKPAALDHVQAAAIPLAALTAWQALVDTAELRARQRVLIHAAAGGVGHFAVQIAKARGAYVIGTASAPNHEFLRGLGADEVIDYRTTDVAEAVRDVDTVLDSIDDDNSIRSLRTLRPGGLLVTLRAFGAVDLAAEASKLGVRAIRMLVEDDHAGMRALAELVESGRLRPTIAGSFPLTDVAKAHALGDTGRTVGKLVVTVP
ncbi:NADPH:quinone reductase-like Zn-dependent oxidoreductase [Nocardia tenerifensis]|uniref:NADPH:quinone reductase-like Zn-dependent oxidoreductase n=1 Tax=Nocardia tenerifensis TaxID=228006 RepID=A0A318JNT4_9NOCA|nr:NADP-dependent oxidoreductase [Nocardia tenerifensis]PXX55641.1 NADPH:quinone reductase-like Zn-dependent oxidoreductase [Nocardia tenerifensis]